jgi:ATP phosphoribosyltransferase
MPAILRNWLDARNITPGGMLVRSGGSEATVAQGRADAVCDLVRTGETLAENGLESKFIVENNISAVVVGRVGLWSAEKSDIARVLLRRLESAVHPVPERTMQFVPARMEIF